jgi:MFS family permease
VTERPKPWLNRNVAGMGAASLLSDAGHESATAVLPGFLALLGLPPLALGVIEGVSDAISSFVKLGAGWFGDRTGKRWGPAVGGYVLTGVMPLFMAAASSWPLVLLGRAAGWLGRGIRGPLRDAMLAASVEPAARGRAFGFHRAADTMGAVLGPLVGALTLALAAAAGAAALDTYRWVFLVAAVPGTAAAVVFALLVRDPARGPTARSGVRGAVRSASPAFRRFLAAVGLFGAGDFAPTLLILAATVLLTPSLGPVGAGSAAGACYLLRNAVYAGASFPIGALSDRLGRPLTMLAGGYLIGALVAVGTAAAFAFGLGQPLLFLALFAGSGLVMALQDTLEAVATAELAPPALRATSYGILGTVNGAGDLIASVGLGALWTWVSPAAGFLTAATVMGLGALLLATEAVRAERGRVTGSGPRQA